LPRVVSFTPNSWATSTMGRPDLSTSTTASRLNSSLNRCTDTCSLTPWNTRELAVTDPDGYALVFTEPLREDLGFEEVLASIRRASGDEGSPLP
jgi:hypothetical protein